MPPMVWTLLPATWLVINFSLDPLLTAATGYTLRVCEREMTRMETNWVDKGEDADDGWRGQMEKEKKENCRRLVN